MINFYYCPILGLVWYSIEKKPKIKIRSKKRKNERK